MGAGTVNKRQSLFIFNPKNGGVMPMKFSKSPQAALRRTRVIKRLENQLLTGFKPVKEDGKMGTAPLDDKDIVRIKKEIEILKTRLL